MAMHTQTVIKRYAGACHCGAVRFTIETDFPELTTCDCSICKKKNARHFFCKICGIYPFHRKRVSPDYLGINVFCLENFDPTGIAIRRTVGAGMP